MEKHNPYGGGVAKLGQEDPHPPERGCGFYVKYFFLFLSLIQFLIILGLVLFMVYGNPQGATEKHVQGLNLLLQNATARGKALEKEAGGLKRQLNASQTETRLARGQATSLNNTLRACVHEKTKMYDLQKENIMIRQIAQECMFNLHFLNLSCPVQVAAHQEQLMALQARAKMAQEDFALKAKLLQGQADQAAKEKEACLVEKLEMQARSDKYRELEAKVLSELEPARQKLASAVDQALSGRALAGCYHSEIASLRERCQDLSGQLRAQLESLGREVDQKVQEVSQQNGALRRQKESCTLHLQERDRRLSAQQDQADREKRILRDSQEAELRKALAEQQKLAREKEELQIQLEQSKQACLRMRINPAPPANPALRLPGGSAVGANPAASFPGLLGNAGALNPSLFNPSGTWRQGQPSVGAQGNPSFTADRTRFVEPKKENPEGGKPPIQPPLTTGGQRRYGWR